MALKGVNDKAVNPLERSGMRTSWTQPEGGMPAYIHEARVIDFNVNNWTVDVRTQFDQKFFPNVQVSSPYMHPNRGEGLYVMPEVNAKCFVCIPSDGPPPFILSFIMPTEQRDGTDESETEGSSGTGSSTYQGGRPRAKPGDIYLKGRDGQYIILHRGGVLQIGSTELSQRLYIPLGNIIADISQNYEHHNTGGTVSWGISSSSTDENPETSYFQTFRLSANSAKADVRVAIGRVHQPTPEPDGDEGEYAQNVAFGLGQGKDNPIVYEVAISPQGFDVDSGAPVSAKDATNLKFVFDKSGNSFLRAEGNVNVRVKKKLRIACDDDMTFVTDGIMSLQSAKKVRIEGSGGVEIVSSGGSVILNGGGKQMAVVGSLVDVLITLPIPIMTQAGPGTIVPGPNARLTGVVSTGCPTVFGPPAG